MTFAEKHDEDEVPEDSISTKSEELVVPRSSKGYALVAQKNKIKKRMQQLEEKKNKLKMAKLEKQKEEA